MKTVLLKYPGGKFKLDKKFKVAASTKGSVFRGYITRDLPQFYDVDYFLLYEGKEQITVLDESKTFGSLSEDKKIIFHLVFTKIDVTLLSCNNQSRNITISLKDTVDKNLLDANIKNPLIYTFAFKPTSDPTFFRITCKSMPLVYQGWFGEQLYIVRRILESEKNNTKELFDECIFSADLGLNMLGPKEWVEAGIYRLMSNCIDPNNVKKKDLIDAIPNNIRVDEQLFAYAGDLLKINFGIKPETAMSKYLKICTSNGCQCCFIDRVQFLVVDGKWRMSSIRYLYISPQYLMISKEIGTTITHKTLISSISEYHIEDEFIIISFKDNPQKWRVKSVKNKKILKFILDDINNILNNANVTEENSKSQENLIGSEKKEAEKEEKPPSLSETIYLSRYNRRSRKDRFSFVEKANGLSPLVIPNPENKDRPFNLAPLVTRDLSCVEIVKIPEEKEISEEDEEDSFENDKSIVDKIPYLNQLDVSPLTKEFILVVTLFVIFLIAKDLFY